MFTVEYQIGLKGLNPEMNRMTLYVYMYLQTQILGRFSLESVQCHCPVFRRGGCLGGPSYQWDLNPDKAGGKHSLGSTNRTLVPLVVYLRQQQDPITFLHVDG